MKCSCGNEIDPSANFCSKCGAKIQVQSRISNCPNLINGVKCNGTIQEDDAFCKICGWKIEKEAFEPGIVMCRAEDCKSIILQESNFCQKCGKPKSQDSATSAEVKNNTSEKTGIQQSDINPCSSSTPGENLQNNSSDEQFHDAPTEPPSVETNDNLDTSQQTSENEPKQFSHKHDDKGPKSDNFAFFGEGIEEAIEDFEGSDYEDDNSGSSVDPKETSAKRKKKKSGIETLSILNPQHKFAHYPHQQDCGELLLVKFHAIVSTKCYEQGDNPKVSLRFDSELMGGWNTLYETTILKVIELGVIIYTEIYLPRQLITGMGNMRYIYTCTVPSSTFMKDEISGQKQNRRKFNIPKDHRGHWHQHDGFVEVFEKSMFAKYSVARIFESAVMEYTKKYAKIFCNVIFSTYSQSLEKLLIHFKMLFFSLLVTGSFQGLDDAKIREMFEKILRSLTENYFESRPREPSAKEPTRILTFQQAVALLHFSNKYRVSGKLKEDVKIKICHSLSLVNDAQNGRTSLLNEVKGNLEDSDIGTDLIELMNGLKKKENPVWLKCVPLLHFLYGESQPYMEAPEISIQNADKWWGVERFQITTSDLRAKKTWLVSEMDILASLEPMFHLDQLLIRTFVRCLSLEKLEQLIKNKFRPTTEAVIHLVALHLEENTELLRSEETKACENCLEYTIHQQRRFQFEKNITKQELQTVIETFQAASKILQKTKCVLPPALTGRVAEIFVVSLLIYENADHKDAEQHEDRVYQLTEKTFTDIWQHLSKQIRCNEYLDEEKKYPLIECVKMWDRLSNIEVSEDTPISAMFNKNLREDIDRYLKKIKTEACVREMFSLYFNKDEKIYIDDSTLEIIGKEVFNRISNGDQTFPDTALPEKNRRKYWRMLCQSFEEHWDEEKCLNLSSILTYPAMKLLLDLHHSNSINMSQRSQENLTTICKFLCEIYYNLKDGKIARGDIEILKVGKAAFIEVVGTAMFLQKGVRPNGLELLLDTRISELDAVMKVHREINFLLREITPLKGFSIKEIYKDEIRLDNGYLCSHCACKMLDDHQKECAEYKPSVKFFGFSTEHLDLLPRTISFFRSNIGRYIWRNQGLEMLDGILDGIEGVPSMIHIFQVVHAILPKWNHICENVKTGNITFKEFESFFEETNSEILAREFECFDDDENNPWKDMRLTQLKQYISLRCSVKFANVISEVVENYNLKGNFSALSDIKKLANGEDMKMSDFDENIMEACQCMNDISEDKINCIAQLNHCFPLIQWIRSTLSDLQEFSVFVDLAMMSVGEGDYEVDRVNYLHTAVTGYAALIFAVDEKCDLQFFIDRCHIVWKEFVADPSLPDKLKDTYRQLQWFKNIEKAQSSVEKNSLEQAKMINSSGMYLIEGKEGKKGLTTNDVLKLHISGKGETEFRSQYSFVELQELQSKLMLVVGKDQNKANDIYRFINVFDSVVRLSNVFIKLLKSGCVLFANWHVKFLCDPSRPVCVFIQFGKGKDHTQLKGKRDPNDEVTTIMPKLSFFLEKCLREWEKIIENKREENHLLNLFTMKQLVILQKELALVRNKAYPSPRLCSLLSCIKKNCLAQDIRIALDQAEKTIQKRENERDEMIPQGINSEKNMYSTSEEEETFIKKLKQAGMSVKMAHAALANGIKPTDAKKGIAWCIAHKNEFQKTESKKKEKVLYELSDSTQQFLNSLPNEKTEAALEPLLESLDSLWNNFLQSIVSNISDYLSVDHLGFVLEELASMDVQKPDRRLLECFEGGCPNLLVCLQDDLFDTILTIYGIAENGDLPSSNEVLLCSEETSLDEIDVFWRRAFFSKNKDVFCIANTGILKLEVSEEAEQRLNRYSQQAKSKNLPFKLIIVCSKETENHCRIAASLEKYRRPPLPLAHLPRQYIEEKLKMENRILINAGLDTENCSVRIVRSRRAGVGKTLYKKRAHERLKKIVGESEKMLISLPQHEKKIKVDEVMSYLVPHIQHTDSTEPRIIHIDLAHDVQENVDYLLFQLLILGSLTNSEGIVWRKMSYDIYLVETMPVMHTEQELKGHVKCMTRCLDIFPFVECRSPRECLDLYSKEKFNKKDLLFDAAEFASEVFQRPFLYLNCLAENIDFNNKMSFRPCLSQKRCLEILLKYCGVDDPSWAELKNFVLFLNTQLEDLEESEYFKGDAAAFFPGFSMFAVKFLLKMSQDFSTRSLHVSEESSNSETCKRENTEQQFQLKRKWETSPHPYLFFNPDRNTMTFLGFTIDRDTGDLIDYKMKKVVEKNILPKKLGIALHQNGVNMQENFENLSRQNKLTKLCTVMGVSEVHDPDETYELTLDNVKKILAIYMRFKCDIPVVIMGETGCGKTRLVDFMCKLQRPKSSQCKKNMIIMKIHGGTSREDILKKVSEAELLAETNATKKIYTVLFFDEANTTEAIGVIKEIMCDKTICGKPVQLHKTLKFVAACNPYRRHSEKMIKKLEQAGLGYYISSKQATDRMGQIPMRKLVYRVQPLPQSMMHLVWDFGTLDKSVEEMYIRQMVYRYIKSGKIPPKKILWELISQLFAECQEYMRKQNDECSFVSLRDVERALDVLTWFYEQRFEVKGENALLYLLDRSTTEEPLSDIVKSVILSLGVCYQGRLQNRDHFRIYIADYFTNIFQLQNGAVQIEEVIERCQDIFIDVIDGLPSMKNVAKNKALKENIFMMVVCIELRIPLFVIGKPGSSKSLAKIIVSDAMQGVSAHTNFYRQLKQIMMVPFQCSHLSAPEGIIDTFRHASIYQKKKDLKRFASVVILDEVGLAEDTPSMPLKILHSLLETGCYEDEANEDYKKVSFIGISNWALDPAKMNRGIFVRRDIPDQKDLEKTASGIYSSDDNTARDLEFLIKPLTEAFLALSEAELKRREFFGLRDFYSLIKMVFAFYVKNKVKPSWLMLKHAILRNFGGLDDENISPIKIFEEKLEEIDMIKNIEETPGDPDCSPVGLIEACLSDLGGDSRYLLLITEHIGAFTLLQQKLLAKQNAVIIFGSSFPADQEYTQICRSINRVKVCMETGQLVVLLNMETIHESLYDALNQNYVYYGGNRYVDLGIGTHRVKCRVHKDFRLIVVADKLTVSKKFPIPLINRFEKHIMNTSNILTSAQIDLKRELETWVTDFVIQASQGGDTLAEGEVFIGYNPDTCASIIHHVCQTTFSDTTDMSSFDESNRKQVIKESQNILLLVATPDAVMRSGTHLVEEMGSLNDIQRTYFHEQPHESLVQVLSIFITEKKRRDFLFLQVTTHSRLLTHVDVEDIATPLGLESQQITLMTLNAFETEHQFCRQLRLSFDENTSLGLTIVQCETGTDNENLINCARHCAFDQLKQYMEDSKIREKHIIFIIHLPRVPEKPGDRYKGFQCGTWTSIHIDELRSPGHECPQIRELVGQKIDTVLENGVRSGPSVTGREDEPENKDQENYSEMEGDVKISENVEQVANRRRFNAQAIVKLCVHSAIKMLIDEDIERPTKRIPILIKWLHKRYKDDEMSFISGICIHLTAILKDYGYQTKQDHAWIATEASSLNIINRVGTFRRAITQCIADKLSPILAGIIAQIDTNRNLDILEECDVDSWKQQLYMSLLNNLKATGIVKSLKSLMLESVSTYAVNGIGFGGHSFGSKMPFFWIIYDIISKTLRITQEEGDAGLINWCSKVIGSKPIGHVLMNSLMSVQPRTFIEAYTHDFVHIVYPVSNYEEHKIVFDEIIFASDAAMKSYEHKTNLIAYFVSVHVGFNELAQRLLNFKEIVIIWPNVCSELCKCKEKDTSEDIKIEEMGCDVVGLLLLLENLEPTSYVFSNRVKRMEWLDQIASYKPVTEKILHFFEEMNVYRIGFNYPPKLEELRHRWTRILVVKLFVNHICEKHEDQAENCMALWMLLGDKADLKTAESFEDVETFIHSSLTATSVDLFGTQKKCAHCEKEIEIPVKLPCNHVICTNCFKEIPHVEANICPVCQSEFPDKFDPDSFDADRNKKIQFLEFWKCCHSFFMAMISQLCFFGGQALSKEVIQKLMSYVISSETDEAFTIQYNLLSLTDEKTQHSSIFRTFLLQRLLRIDSQRVVSDFQEYLATAKRVFKSEKGGLLEFFTIMVFCFEDWELANESVGSDTQRTRYLEESKKLLSDSLHEIERIICLAKTRIGLTCVAKLLYEEVVLKQTVDGKEILERATEIFQNHLPQSRNFVIDYIYHEFGHECLQEICRSKSYKTYFEPIGDGSEECDDRFLIYGEEYSKLKEKLDSLIEDPAQGEASFMFKEDQLKIPLTLALFKLEWVYKRGGKQKQFVHFKKVCSKKKSTSKDEESIVQLFLKNDLHEDWGISMEEDLKSQNIMCFLFHFYVTLREAFGKKSFLTPLANFVFFKQNSRMKDYLHLPGIRRKGITVGTDLHQDHVNVNIGISKSRFYPENLQPVSETAENVFVSLFTHAAILFAISKNCSSVKSFVAKNRPKGGLQREMIEILMTDMNIIQSNLSIRKEDLYLLLHKFCLVLEKQGEIISGLHTFDSADIVKKWEDDFVEHISKPTLEAIDQTLMDLNQMVSTKCKKVPVLQEDEMTMTSEESSEVKFIYKWPSVWKYRKILTIETIKHIFQSRLPPDNCRILQLFLKKEKDLRAIRFLPNILKLQRFLIGKYRYTLDEEKASTMLIKHLFKGNEEDGVIHVRELFEDFQEAWRCVHSSAATCFVPVPYEKHSVRIPENQYRAEFTEDLTVTKLLPSYKDEGMCSYVLLYHLFDTQNKFLEALCNIRKEKYTALKRISPREVMSSHLICFHPQNDIVSLVLENSHYTYNANEDTHFNIQFNYTEIERDLVDRFLFAKPVIEPLRYDQFDTMVYRKEITTGALLKELRQKLKQEQLTPAKLHEICDEIKDHTDVCSAQENVELAIRFLISIGDDPDLLLEDYLTKTLQKDAPFTTIKITQCRCKHIQALWVALSLKKAKMKATYPKDMFSVDTKYRRELRGNLIQEITGVVKDLPKDTFINVYETLFECIVLHVISPESMMHSSFNEMWEKHVADPPYFTSIATQQEKEAVQKVISKVPKVHYSEAISLWTNMYLAFLRLHVDNR